MNSSIVFAPERSISCSSYAVPLGVVACGSAAFLAVWGGQTEREAAFLNVKLHAARFRVCIGLLADRRVAAAVCKQTLFQGGVVGADMDKGALNIIPSSITMTPAILHSINCFFSG